MLFFLDIFFSFYMRCSKPPLIDLISLAWEPQLMAAHYLIALHLEHIVLVEYVIVIIVKNALTLYCKFSKRQLLTPHLVWVE